jgi:hypothetical protein
MEAMAQFAVLTLATIFAGVLALGMTWAFLLGAFHLMQPAAVRKTRTSALRGSQLHSDLVPGTPAAAWHLVVNR